jgi:hypothetical protein
MNQPCFFTTKSDERYPACAEYPSYSAWCIVHNRWASECDATLIGSMPTSPTPDIVKAPTPSTSGPESLPLLVLCVDVSGSISVTFNGHPISMLSLSDRQGLQQSRQVLEAVLAYWRNCLTFTLDPSQ